MKFSIASIVVTAGLSISAGNSAAQPLCYPLPTPEYCNGVTLWDVPVSGIATVDVLVVYTSEVATALAAACDPCDVNEPSPQEVFELSIQNCESYMNAALADSISNTRIRVVGIRALPSDFIDNVDIRLGVANEDLSNRLANPLSQLAIDRNSLGADVVMVISEYLSSVDGAVACAGGGAEILSTCLSSAGIPGTDPDSSVAIVPRCGLSLDDEANPRTFAHELGHLLGLEHDDAYFTSGCSTPIGGGPMPIGTIMNQGNSIGGCSLIARFSNPDPAADYFDPSDPLTPIPTSGGAADSVGKLDLFDDLVINNRQYADSDLNGVPDECQSLECFAAGYAAPFNVVDQSDQFQLLTQMGRNRFNSPLTGQFNPQYDLDNNGEINFFDLTILSGLIGQICN